MNIPKNNGRGAALGNKSKLREKICITKSESGLPSPPHAENEYTDLATSSL